MNKKEINEWAKEAELLCRDYLLKQGYTIREQNWRAKGGVNSREIDLIAEKDAVLVFIEVKTRHPDGEDPFDAVNEKKIRRICAAADTYLRKEEYDYDWRFDIIGVTGTCREDAVIEHVPDAFLPPLTTR